MCGGGNGINRQFGDTYGDDVLLTTVCMVVMAYQVSHWREVSGNAISTYRMEHSQ